MKRNKGVRWDRVRAARAAFKSGALERVSWEVWETVARRLLEAMKRR